MCEDDDLPDDRLIDRAVAALRRPMPLDDRFGDRFEQRVMHRVRAGSASRIAHPNTRSMWRWLVEPRTVRVSPLSGLAVAAGLLGAALLADLHARTTGAASRAANVAARVAESRALTQFVLVAPGAHSVSLVGDFNDWRVGALPLRATAAGRVWTVAVSLGAGRHRYAFVVDGQRWMPDPAAPTDARDDFGSPSSVVTVVEHRT